MFSPASPCPASDTRALKIAALLLVLLLTLCFGLGLYTWFRARALEAAYPNRGTLIDVGGFKMNALHVPQGPKADLPPLVFIHGASGNLLDPAGAFLKPLSGRAELLFVDRPGHGYSERGGPENAFPAGQADAIVKVMDHHHIDKAILVAHSFGGSIAASLALRHPERVSGLLFLAPATHPWPGGIDWYYRVASTPVIGWLFTHLITLPAGLERMESGARAVFHPNPVPPSYTQNAAIPLVLRPATFAANAEDVANLHDYVSRIAKDYPKITAPTVIITGDSDDIVLEEIHARGLARDVKGSELLWIKGLGHKPDYIATGLAISAIEKLAGKPHDLQAEARTLEQTLRAH